MAVSAALIVAVTSNVVPSENVPLRAKAPPATFPEIVSDERQPLLKNSVPEKRIEPSGLVMP